MRLGKKDFQIAAEISNDYDNLIPVGTLLYYDIPCSHALQGMKVGRGTWSAFDADFLHEIYGTNMHESLKSLVFLVRHRFFAATFKFVRPNAVYISGKVPLILGIIRVYAVPLDIDGSRFLRSWRRSWSKSPSSLDKKFRESWEILLKYLDFSCHGWMSEMNLTNHNLDNRSLSNSGNSRKMAIPFSSMNSKSESTFNNFHNTQRWIEGSAFCGSRTSPVSLETIVKDIYKDIETPDLSAYSMLSTDPCTGVPSSEEAIAQILYNSQSSTAQIEGMLSTLYPFQLRSVCKMYEKESMSSKACVPHFLQLRSPLGSTYYFDSTKFGFYSYPELYDVPKGGILAENMGLGKTLICLALVCLTKHEISSIPSNLMVNSPPQNKKINPKLSDLLVTKIAQKSLPWRYFVKNLPANVVEKLKSTHGHFHVASDQIHANSGLRGRHTENTQINWKQLFLSNSTLVVVPENLLHQWNDEARKHVHATFLNKLFISERFKTHLRHESSDYRNTPPHTPEDLIAYDLVVISSSLFSKICVNSENVFMRVYWKRLIIDEGHSMSSRTSNLSVSCKLLYSERRWVVTGTPTSGLTNLHMDEHSSETTLESPRKRRKYVVKGKFNVRDDLAKLGSLVSNYFKIEPFCSQPGLWGSSVIKNLANHNQLTAKMSLQNLLNSLMVRHGQAQVEADLQLPQLHHEAVFLEPSFHNKLAINLFTAVLAVNAVSSERVGVDYMFDSSNRQQLQRLMINFQLSTFYWTGFKISDAQTLVDVCGQCLEKKDTDGNPYYEEADRCLLKKSLFAVKRAIGNPRWRTSATLHEMQIYVSGLPSLYNRYFAKGFMDSIGVYGAPQLGAVQKFFYKHRFSDHDQETKLNARLEEASGLFWKDYRRQSQKVEKGKFTKTEPSARFDTDHLKDDSELASLKMHGNDNYSKDISENIQKSEDDPKKALVLGTASAKLSYLASKLVSHQKDEIKSIVFFEFEDSAYYLTELLDILGVAYILYATFVGAEQRSHNLSNFASHDSVVSGGITLIMDLKLAAHGLTVISATRVYFISPVWQRAVEAQAIKRAHRIGQTQEVHVETLVLKGTLEEEIYHRRLSEDAQDENNTDAAEKKYVIDDMGMQSFVLRHAFLPVGDTEREYADFSSSASKMEREFRDLPDTASHYSLLSHSSQVADINGQIKRNWTMRLFNEGNLQKLNASKQEKPGLEQLNTDFTGGKDHVVPTFKSKVAARKSVRF